MLGWTVPAISEGTAVVDGSQPDAAVLSGNLHAERTDGGEFGEVGVRDTGLPLDQGAVQRLAHRTQLGKELFAALSVLEEPCGCG